MDQEKAVKLMMLELRILQEDLDLDVTLTFEERYSILKRSLESKLKLMWVVGSDHRGKELGSHNKKRIGYYNKLGEILEEFDSVKDAAKSHKISRDAIDKVLCGKSRADRRGNTWGFL